MEQEISECDLYIEEKNKKLTEMIKGKKFFSIKFFLNKKFSKNYKEEIASIKKEIYNQRKRKENLLFKKGVELENEKINDGQIEALKEKEKEMLLLEDDNYGIEKLINENPSVLENEDVMIDLYLRNIEYIYFDKTDSNKVYFYFINEISKIYDNKTDELKKEKDKLFKNIDKINKSQKEDINYKIAELSKCIQMNEEKHKFLNYVMEEIIHPKVPTAIKYKIPHKFLFEAIRKGILDVKDKGSSKSLDIAERVLSVCHQYIDLDLKLPLYFGKKLESLYTDENTDLYIYSTDSSNESNVNFIFKNGLYLEEEYNMSLDRIALSKYNNGCSFFDFLKAEEVDKILLSIPKEDYEIFGNNTNISNYVYVLPKYVVGEIKNSLGSAKFVENNVPISERTVYGYLYSGYKNSGDEAEVKSSMHR